MRGDVARPEERVVLVTPDDRPIGVAGKTSAHERGLLHRAFSVFVVNGAGEWLLQRRASHKYHSGGLWSNTCCSHPRDGETPEDAVHRRMMEEMGFDCEVEKAFHFTYKADVGQGLTEHEFDHVFIGKSELIPVINPEEVNDWKYMAMDEIRLDMKKKPDVYTVWFRIAFDEVDQHLKKL